MIAHVVEYIFQIMTRPKTQIDEFSSSKEKMLGIAEIYLNDFV